MLQSPHSLPADREYSLRDHFSLTFFFKFSPQRAENNIKRHNQIKTKAGRRSRDLRIAAWGESPRAGDHGPIPRSYASRATMWRSAASETPVVRYDSRMMESAARTWPRRQLNDTAARRAVPGNAR